MVQWLQLMPSVLSLTASVNSVNYKAMFQIVVAMYTKLNEASRVRLSTLELVGISDTVEYLST